MKIRTHNPPVEPEPVKEYGRTKPYHGFCDGCELFKPDTFTERDRSRQKGECFHWGMTVMRSSPGCAHRLPSLKSLSKKRTIKLR